MKTKAKLILAMSVLTAGVVAAGATGTFAWFTTNRAAQLNYTSVTAQKNAGNLNVSMAGELANGSGWSGEVQHATVPDKGSMASATVTAASHMSDVSSQDGVKFDKPIWKTVAGKGQEVDRVDAGVRGVDYSVFYFKVENTGSHKLQVFLNSATAIKPSTSDNENDKAAAKYTRFAINKATKDGSNDAPVFALTASETLLVENENGVEGYDGQVLAVSEDKKANVTSVSTPKFFMQGGSDSSNDLVSINSGNAAGNADQKLCELAANNGVAYFTVSVWLEGTKGDGGEFEKASGGKVNILLDLAGVEAA